MWHLLGVCQHDHTKHSGPLVRVQREVWQRVHREWCPGSRWKDSEVAKLEKGIEVLQVKESIQIIGTEGSIPVTWDRWVWISQRCYQEIKLSRMSLYVLLHSNLLLPSQPSEWPLILSLNDSTFFSQMVPHCIFNKPLLSQMNCLILFVSHSHCSTIAFAPCIHLESCSSFKYWLLTILSYTLHSIPNLYFT